MEVNKNMTAKRVLTKDLKDGYTYSLFNFNSSPDSFVRIIGKRKFAVRKFNEAENVFVIDKYHLNYVVGGDGSFDGHPLQKGTGFLICPGQPHRFYSSNANPIVHFWIALDGVFAQSLLSKSFANLENHVFDCPWIDEALPFLDSCIMCDLDNKDVPDFMMAITKYLLSFHKASVSEASSFSKQNAYVKSAKVFMESNYNKDISVEDIANHVGLCSKYLCHIFKQTEKISTQRYLINLRLTVATQLLLQTPLKIAKIARTCGYSDVYIFSKMFRKQYGMSPGEYRKNK